VPRIIKQHGWYSSYIHFFPCSVHLCITSNKVTGHKNAGDLSLYKPPRINVAGSSRYILPESSASKSLGSLAHPELTRHSCLTGLNRNQIIRYEKKKKLALVSLCIIIGPGTPRGKRMRGKKKITAFQLELTVLFVRKPLRDSLFGSGLSAVSSPGVVLCAVLGRPLLVSRGAKKLLRTTT